MNEAVKATQEKAVTKEKERKNKTPGAKVVKSDLATKRRKLGFLDD